MKILHTIPSVDPAQGGTIEAIRQYHRELDRAGHVVEIASIDPPEAPWVADCPLTTHALGPAKLKYGYSPRFIPWLRANASRYDCVIVNGLWQFSSFASRQALRQSGTPYFVFTHGMLDPWFKQTYPLKHLKKLLYWRWADYRVLRDAQAVLFTCEEERQLAGKSFSPYRCRQVVVNLGTSRPSGDAPSQRDCFLDRFPALRGKRLLLFLSRIHPKKGCDLLIEAFARVMDKDPSLHLVLAGPDQTGWQAALAQRAEALGVSARLTWTGMLTGDLKWGAFHAAEAFVLPSHQENFGIAVAEALACGLPVLISNKVNIWREIAADRAGLVACDDVEGTQDILQRWIEMTAGQRQAMRERAAQCFETRFEIGHAAQSLIQTLHKEGVPT